MENPQLPEEPKVTHFAMTTSKQTKEEEPLQLTKELQLLILHLFKANLFQDEWLELPEAKLVDLLRDLAKKVVRNEVELNQAGKDHSLGPLLPNTPDPMRSLHGKTFSVSKA